MALTTFVPTISPSPGTQTEVQLALNKSEFGDGYTQAGPKGLNHIRHSVQLKWDGLTLVQLTSLRSFMEARGGYQSFYYQPPGFSSVLKWTCDAWSMSASSPYTFSSTLTQSFTNEA
jgi:phage-related protein